MTTTDQHTVFILVYVHFTTTTTTSSRTHSHIFLLLATQRHYSFGNPIFHGYYFNSCTIDRIVTKSKCETYMFSSLCLEDFNRKMELHKCLELLFGAQCLHIYIDERENVMFWKTYSIFQIVLPSQFQERGKNCFILKFSLTAWSSILGQNLLIMYFHKGRIGHTLSWRNFIISHDLRQRNKIA